jgi:alkanesulfonate monooxygenase SsuD/methylene tetrahydromethanopterin reductase-like flavin-dependent oxidoreductase (luciferase family)
VTPVKLDLLLDPFDATWVNLRDAALAAEEAGFDGLWTWDHLAGQSHRASRVLECWTTLSALAPIVPRVALGPLVLNVANRRPGVLATAAATLQEISGGRLLLGLGAGGGRTVPYPAEQLATGVAVPADPVRRQQVVETAAVLRQLWTGVAVPMAGEHHSLGSATGFIVPEPAPPIIIGAFGPKMAAVAGAAGDGINTHASARGLPALLDVARRAHAETGRDPADFVVTLSAVLDARSFDPDVLERFASLGVHRVVHLLHPPFDIAAIRAMRLPARTP